MLMRFRLSSQVIFLHKPEQFIYGKFQHNKEKTENCSWVTYSAFTETGATQTMRNNQMAELEKYISTFSNLANQIFGKKQWILN